jgi:high-affinity iron transporter
VQFQQAGGDPAGDSATEEDLTAFLLSIREGLEAVLLVSILLGTLRRLGRLDLARYVWLGVGLAVTISLTAAAALSAAGIELTGPTEAIFEGGTLLLAAAVLTGMLFWMRRQGGALSARLASEVQRAAQSDVRGDRTGDARTAQYGSITLFSVAFLAVVREGIELALLLAASVFGSSAATAAVGAVAGLGTAAVFGVLLFKGVVGLNYKRFFQVSNVIMIVFAAGMVALGVHELVEGGLLPGLIAPVWNTGAVLSDESTIGGILRAVFGYTSDPALIEILAYVGYLTAVSWALWFRPRRQPVVAR